MKICILGNSHAAALKHGWDIVAGDYADVTVNFYSMLGQNLGDLELDGRHLVLKEQGSARLRCFPEGISETVDLDLYDGFILHGLGLRVRPLDAPGLSAAVREAIVLDSVHETALWTLLNDIRKVSHAPVRVGPTPLLAAEEVKTRGPSKGYHGFIEKARSLCFDALEATVVPQPDDTIVNDCMTDPKFNTEVVPFKGKQAKKKRGGESAANRDHMNPAYGAVMMTRYLDSLRTEGA